MSVENGSKSCGKSSRKRHVHSFELKRRAVKLCREEGYSIDLVAEELGVGHSTLNRWAKLYRDRGEAGLQAAVRRVGTPKVAAAVKQKAVELKVRNPMFGTKRISHLLRRMFFLKAGPETVRRTLQEEHLIQKQRVKPKKNPAKPRFFERATPNQMWQADIFSFRLGGRAAYLIGYVDDYSRYVTGLDLFRSQTAEHVLEVYRQAVAEYGLPKEMLTDNGRQYTNWRGKTRFEAELVKDRIRHIKSRPHHPMTLGKIERLWKTIWVEFLCRAQFDSFEEARDRVRLWIKYYNYKRPHQGIGGLCPADRFFEIQHQMRRVLEEGVAENVLEQALRGKPQAPFYLVGRMGEQSVVIRAEKGKVRMLVDGDEGKESRELVYKVEGGHGNEGGNAAEACGAEASAPVRCEDEVRGGAVGVVREAPSGGGVPGTGDTLGDVERLAEPCDGGDVAGAESETVPGKQAGGAESPAGTEAGAEAGEGRQAATAAEGGGGSLSVPGKAEGINHEEGTGTQRIGPGSSPAAGGDDPESAQRSDDGPGSSPSAGDQPQDVLQVGETGPVRDAFRALRAELGPTGFTLRWGEDGTEGDGGGSGEGPETEAAERGDKEVAEG